MDTSSSPSLKGQIFLAVLGKLPAENSKAESEHKVSKEDNNQNSGERFVIVVGFCFLGCFMLAGAALIRHEWNGLPFLALGLSCWVVLQAILKIAQAVRQRRSSQGNTAIPATRDERSVVIVDRLKEYTKTGALGKPVALEGTTTWLTDDGLYLSNGRYVSWSRFSAFALFEHYEDVIHVKLQKPLPRMPFSVRGILALVFLTIAVTAVLETIEAVKVFQKFGLRDDGLALVLAAIGSLLLLIGVYNIMLKEMNLYLRRATVFLALLSKQYVSAKELEFLLRQHLPEQKQNSDG